VLVIIEGCPGSYFSYGKVAKYIGKYLLENGFDVSYICGDSEYEITLEKGLKNAKVYPNAVTMENGRVIANSYSYYADKLNADYIIAIGGPWSDPLKSEMLSFNLDKNNNPKLKKVKLIGYFSFDWFFAPTSIKQQFLYPHVVALPTDAERRYASIPIDRFVKVPHGVNSNYFNPEANKKKIDFQIKPDLIIGSVMKNHGRKNWAIVGFVASALNVWGIKTALLPLTTSISGSQNWWDILNIFQGNSDFFPVVYGYMNSLMVIRPNTSVELGYGFDEKDQAEVMKLMDIHILPTRGEGFSLATLESIALGIPNIVSDNEVLREVFGNFKSVVFAEKANMWMWPREGTLFYDPSFIDFTDKTIDVAEHIDEYKELAYKDSKTAIKYYTWENSGKQMLKAISLSDKFDTTMFEDTQDYMSAAGRRWSI